MIKSLILIKTIKKIREKPIKVQETEWNIGQKSKDKLISRWMNVIAPRTRAEIVEKTYVK